MVSKRDPWFEHGMSDFRLGDEPEDTRIGDFKVFAGDLATREALQTDDPQAIGKATHDLDELLAAYERETG